MRLRYLNCGHHPPLIFRENELLELTEGETALGLFPDLPRTTTEVDLKPGDVVVLYTDGIIEAENSAGKQYTADRLKVFLEDHKTLPPAAIKEKLIRELNAYAGTDHFEDDVTFIIFKITF